MIKVGLPFLYSSMEKQFRKHRPIFDIEKWLWKSELCCFQPSILKWPKGQKYFIAIFIVHLTYLLTTKLSWLQKNKWGHTNYLAHWIQQPISKLRILNFQEFSIQESDCFWLWTCQKFVEILIRVSKLVVGSSKLKCSS